MPLVAYLGHRAALPVLIQDMAGMRQGRDVSRLQIGFHWGDAFETVSAPGKDPQLIQTLVPYGRGDVQCGIGVLRHESDDPEGDATGLHMDEGRRFLIGTCGWLEGACPGTGHGLPDGQARPASPGKILVEAMARSCDSPRGVMPFLHKALRGIHGRYALVCLCAEQDDTLWCACRNMPLFHGREHKEQFVSTEVKRIVAHCSDVHALENGAADFFRIPASRQAGPSSSGTFVLEAKGRYRGGCVRRVE